METFKNRPTSRILGQIHGLLMAANVKVHSEGYTLSFRGLVGETRITVSPSKHRAPAGLEVSEIIRIESVVDMQLPKEMECALNMQASTGALVVEDDGKFRIESRFSLYAGETDNITWHYAGILFFVAMTHTDALQAAVVDALQLPVSKAPRLDSAAEGRWDPTSFSQAAAMLNRSGAFANGDGTGLTAEFPWDVGAFSAGLDSLAAGPTKRTSRLQIERAEHPNLGMGIFCRLDLPLQLDDSEASRLAMSFNRMEATAEDWPPLLGAWTSKPKSGRPTFVSFWSDSFAKVISVDKIVTWMAARASRVRVLALSDAGLMTATADGSVQRSSSETKSNVVAAAQCQQLATGTIQVESNFGGLPTAAETIHSGISAIYRESCRRAAAERGVQPRQMQSGVWASLHYISPDAPRRISVKDGVESDIERKSDTSIRKSAPSQARDGSEDHTVTTEVSNPAKEGPRDGTGAPTSTPTAKDYVYAVLGIITFFIAMSFTQAGSVLLHRGTATRELLAPAIVSSFRDMTSWIFWVASAAYLLVGFGSVIVFLRVFKREKKWSTTTLMLMGLIRMFVIPFLKLSFLAVVLWAFAASLTGVQVNLLTLPFSTISKAAVIALGFGMLLLAALEKASLNCWKYSGFWLAVTGTFIIAQLSIPETLLGKHNFSATNLYPGVLILSTCWAFAILVSWLGDILGNRLFGDHEFRKTLLAEAIGVIGGFMSLCFLFEYARITGA